MCPTVIIVCNTVLDTHIKNRINTPTRPSGLKRPCLLVLFLLGTGSLDTGTLWTFVEMSVVVLIHVPLLVQCVSPMFGRLRYSDPQPERPVCAAT